MKIKKLAPGLVFLALAIIMVALTDLEEKPNFYPSMVGKELPTFVTENLEGENISQNDFKGNIINFWASWCVACKQEHELLLNLSKRGYPIIGVNSGDNKNRAIEYLDNSGNPYLFNAYDPKRTLAVSMGNLGLPETYVIDNDGMIEYHFRGVLTRNEIFNNLLPVADKYKIEK